MRNCHRQVFDRTLPELPALSSDRRSLITGRLSLYLCLSWA